MKVPEFLSNSEGSENQIQHQKYSLDYIAKSQILILIQ
jgi:hypothetical protein